MKVYLVFIGVCAIFAVVVLLALGVCQGYDLEVSEEVEIERKERRRKWIGWRVRVQQLASINSLRLVRFSPHRVTYPNSFLTLESIDKLSNGFTIHLRFLAMDSAHSHSPSSSSPSAQSFFSFSVSLVPRSDTPYFSRRGDGKGCMIR